MEKCKNCTRYYAHQVCRYEVVVDQHGNWEKDASKTPYDADTPFGPFVCVDCRQEKELLDSDDR